MGNRTIKDLKQELIDVIANIDKEKITISDLKVLAECINILSTVNDNPINYLDIIASMTSNGFGYKPTTVSDLKGE